MLDQLTLTSIGCYTLFSLVVIYFANYIIIQITQQRLPIAQNGVLEFDVVDKQGHFQYKTQVRIERIQIEQDSGKSLHNLSDELTLVDLNRAGMGLLEIVFAPDLQTPLEASSCLRAIQKLFRHIGVCDGNMQDGSMRCDVNVSVGEHRDIFPVKSVSSLGEDVQRTDDRSSEVTSPVDVLVPLVQGNRVEVKNINSIQSVNAAATYEIHRHVDLLEKQNTFQQETRGYDDTNQSTFTMRAKETAVDYRIFPDPDIPVLVLTDSDIQEAMQSAEGEGHVELPEVTLAHMMRVHALDRGQAEGLLALPGALSYFEAMCAIQSSAGHPAEVDDETADHKHKHMDATESSSSSSSNSDGGCGGGGGSDLYNWMMGDLQGNLNSHYFTFLNSPVQPSQLHSLINQVKEKHISALQAKKVLKCLFEMDYLGMDPLEIIEKKGWKQITDSVSLTPLIQEALFDPKNMKKLQTYQNVSNKRDRMTSFFFGEVMKKSQGQASPQVVKQLLAEALEKTLH